MKARFRKFGLVKERYHPCRTFCDFDDGARSPSLAWLWKVARVIHRRVVWCRLDRTRHGWHMIVQWNRRMEPWACLALQAILGSDNRREAMNWARLAADRKDSFSAKRWNILYERKIQ